MEGMFSLTGKPKQKRTAINLLSKEKHLVTNWESIGSVKAAVLSNSLKNYTYTDTKLQSGKYQYRLKIIDNDGIILIQQC